MTVRRYHVAEILDTPRARYVVVEYPGGQQVGQTWTIQAFAERSRDELQDAADAANEAEHEFRFSRSSATTA